MASDLQGPSDAKEKLANQKKLTEQKVGEQCARQTETAGILLTSPWPNDVPVAQTLLPNLNPLKHRYTTN